MARAATTSDVFNAIAEPARRRVLEALRDGERSVGAIVEDLGLTQPQVSKHLSVLRDVGLVTSRAVGRERRYRLQADGLRTVHEWTTGFAAQWNTRLDRLDAVLDDMQSARRSGASPTEPPERSTT